MDSKRFVPYIIVILVLLAVGAFYVASKRSAGVSNSGMVVSSPMMSSQDMMSASPSGMMASDSAMMASGSAATGKVDTVTIAGSNFKFTPNAFTVNKGDTVKVTFQNSGGSHDFVIDEFSAHSKIIRTGESDTVQFVADKAGTFQFYCSVDGHRGMGMVGTLTVK